MAVRCHVERVVRANENAADSSARLSFRRGFLGNLYDKVRGRWVAMTEFNPSVDEDDDAFVAGYDFVDEMVPRAERVVGGAPMWFGWAIREAFWAGVQWEREKTCNTGRIMNRRRGRPLTDLSITELCRALRATRKVLGPDSHSVNLLRRAILEKRQTSKTEGQRE